MAGGISMVVDEIHESTEGTTVNLKLADSDDDGAVVNFPGERRHPWMRIGQSVTVLIRATGDASS